MMKAAWILFFICFGFISNADNYSIKDSLKRSNYFVEAHVGFITYYHVAGTNSNNDIHSKLSYNFNLGFYKRSKHFSIGLLFDFLHYNLEGGASIVGTTEYHGRGSPLMHRKYYISQELKFNTISPGLSFTYFFNYKAIIADLGLHINSLFYRSEIKLSNSYVGEQPTYIGYPLPLEEKNFQSTESYDQRFAPSAGISLKIGFAIKPNIILSCINDLNFCPDVRIGGNTYGSLPTQCIYDMNKQIWLISGLSARWLF